MMPLSNDFNLSTSLGPIDPALNFSVQQPGQANWSFPENQHLRSFAVPTGSNNITPYVSVSDGDRNADSGVMLFIQ